jgi:hypothetical protein
VFELLSEQGATCERTSIDEAYVDVTALATAALPTLAAALAAAPTDVLQTHAVGAVFSVLDRHLHSGIMLDPHA